VAQALSTDRIVGSPAWKFLGIEVVEVTEGRAVIEMVPADELVNFAGVVHGGFISMLADSAMGRALHSALPQSERHVTFDLKMNFINAVKAGERLRATGTVVRAGQRIALCECRVEGPEGRLVATATGTFSVYLPSSNSSSA
jgi:uncharacterized protein (TIGR00369 family)